MSKYVFQGSWCFGLFFLFDLIWNARLVFGTFFFSSVPHYSQAVRDLGLVTAIHAGSPTLLRPVFGHSPGFQAVPKLAGLHFRPFDPLGKPVVAFSHQNSINPAPADVELLRQFFDSP